LVVEGVPAFVEIEHVLGYSHRSTSHECHEGGTVDDDLAGVEVSVADDQGYITQRHTSPTRRSISATEVRTFIGPHQRTNSSGSVNAPNTRSMSASNVRSSRTVSPPSPTTAPRIGSRSASPTSPTRMRSAHRSNGEPQSAAAPAARISDAGRSEVAALAPRAPGPAGASTRLERISKAGGGSRRQSTDRVPAALRSHDASGHRLRCTPRRAHQTRKDT
jgi:hypothetical protein